MAKKKSESSRSVTKWDEKFANEAKKYADREKVAAGTFISLKNGIMSFGGNAIDGNKIGCIILDSIFVNAMYKERFDPDNPKPPTCFSIGHDEDDLKPHEDVKKPCNEQCDGCENNEWGSADTGKGKKCKNSRRLGIIPAGNLNKKTGEFEPYDDIEDYSTAEAAFLSLPITSTKAFASYVHQLADVVGRPPWAVYTKIFLTHHDKHQFHVNFEYLGNVDDDYLEVLEAKAKEVEKSIMFAFDMSQAEEDEPKKQAKTAVKKPAAKKTKKY